MRLKHKNLEIRPATIKDAEYLYSYWSQDSWNTTTLEELRAMLAGGKTQYMVELNGQLIGDVHYGEVENNGAEVGLYIRDENQMGKGYGTLILYIFIDILFKNFGYDNVVFMTGENNKPMRYISESKFNLTPIIHKDLEQPDGTLETCIEYVLNKQDWQNKVEYEFIV